MKAYLLEIYKDGSARKLGPYETTAQRRMAGLEMLAEGRQMIEIDAHKEDFFAFAVPKCPEHFK